MKARRLSVVCGLFLVLSGCAGRINDTLERALPGYTLGLKYELPPEGPMKDWCLPEKDDPAQFTSAAALTGTALSGSDKGSIEAARTKWLADCHQRAQGKVDRLERRLNTPPSDDPGDEQAPSADQIPTIKDGVKRWKDCVRVIEAEKLNTGRKVGQVRR